MPAADFRQTPRLQCQLPARRGLVRQGGGALQALRLVRALGPPADDRGARQIPARAYDLYATAGEASGRHGLGRPSAVESALLNQLISIHLEVSRSGFPLQVYMSWNGLQNREEQSSYAADLD
jgi:hypothetical protein